MGDNSQAEFYSVAVTNNHQEADTGTKMIHIGKNTRSTIISKGISAGKSQNSYRGLVKVGSKASGARNYSSCSARSVVHIPSRTSTWPIRMPRWSMRPRHRKYQKTSSSIATNGAYLRKMPCRLSWADMPKK